MKAAMQWSASADAATLPHEGDIVVQEPIAGATTNGWQPGHIFGGYRIVRPLGQGGMGTVYEAEHIESGRRLALKVLSHSLDSPEARQRFLREGRLAASVNHPNIVYVFGTEDINSTPVIAMELVAGGTLKDRVHDRGPLPVQQAVDAVLQVIDGLEAAQGVSVLHRDVKPSNCFVDGDGMVKIGDFGLSISSVARTELHLTVSGVFLGTPTFASPEQLRGDELDARSDMYALGVTLYYLLTGKVPFEADNMVRLVATVLERPASAPRNLRPEIPAALNAVILKCLEKQPTNRFKTYADLRQALLPFSSFVPAPAPLPIRFVAGVIDFVGVFLVTGAPALLLTLLGVRVWDLDRLTSNSVLPSSWTTETWYEVLHLLLWVTYYAVPEAIWGASLGKWLCRLRVADSERQPPGLLRAAGRVGIYALLPPLPMMIYFHVVNDPNLVTKYLGWSLLAIFSFYPLLALLFVTCRRHNGNAAVHDLLTGIRVILRPAAAQRPALAEAQTPVPEPAGAELIGPYHVLDVLQQHEWLLGYDTRLLRKVWIHRLPAHAPELPVALRSLTRAGRLRWLGGRRSANENWDAFEAPTGRALWQLLEHPQPWSTVRFWLMDLAEELGSALKDGTMPAHLGLDRVWITADGRAKLLDMQAPGVQSAAGDLAATTTDVEPLRQFLYQVAAASLAGQRVSAREARNLSIDRPLPLHAQNFLEGLVHVQRPEVAAAQLQSLTRKRCEVSQRRRLALVALCVAAPLLAALFNLPGQLLLRTSKQQLPQADELQTAVSLYSPVVEFHPLNAEQKKALAVYMASKLRKVITDDKTWKNFYLQTRLTEEQRSAAKRVVQELQPTEAEARAAAKIAEPLLEKRMIMDPFQGVGVLTFAVIIFGGTLLMYVAVPSLVCALAFRGGMLWAILGLTAVTNKGARASRWRVLWRDLLAWSPALFYPIGLALLMPVAGLVWSNVVLLTMYAVLLVWSNCLPQRGLPDRLAGTWLVMR